MNERKAFNFYRSYFEVAQQLPKKYQLGFLQAILDYQFNGVEPSSVKGFELAWVSQKHSLDRQLEGYKHGIKGGRPPKGSDNHPLKGRSNQDKDKGQVQYVRANIESSAVWLEGVAMLVKLPIFTTTNLLKDFLDEQELKGYEDTEKKCKEYFINWIKQNKPKEAQDNIYVDRSPVN